MIDEGELITPPVNRTTSVIATVVVMFTFDSTTTVPDQMAVPVNKDVRRLEGQGRLVGRQAGQAGWSAGWQASRQVGRQGRLVGRQAEQAGWSAGKQAGRSVGRLAGRRAGWQGRLAGWQVGGQAGRAGWQVGRQGRQAGRQGRLAGRRAGRQGRLAGRAGRPAGWSAGWQAGQVGRLAGRQGSLAGWQAGQFGRLAGRQAGRQVGPSLESADKKSVGTRLWKQMMIQAFESDIFDPMKDKPHKWCLQQKKRLECSQTSLSLDEINERTLGQCKGSLEHDIKCRIDMDQDLPHLIAPPLTKKAPIPECYNRGEKGHKKPDCPNLKGKINNMDLLADNQRKTHAIVVIQADIGNEVNINTIQGEAHLPQKWKYSINIGHVSDAKLLLNNPDSGISYNMGQTCYPTAYQDNTTND
ncbi:hypothetical protein BY996DRAFT_6517616 [Phakopsora pachyrhizi]|nr:hypothetical protein BY996DRAFT_6517616 [Phakopsora pachyrhizi]